MKRIGSLLLAGLIAATPLVAQSIHVSQSVGNLEAAARQDSNDAVAWYNLSLGYMSHQRWDDADTTLGRALALDPQLALAWLARSVVQDRNDRFWHAFGHGPAADSGRIAELRRRVADERRAYLLDPFVDLTILGGFYQFDDAHDAVAYFFGRDAARYDDGLQTGIQGLVEGDAARAYDGFELAKAAFYQIAGNLNRDSVPEHLLFLHGMAAARSNHLTEAEGDFQTLTTRDIRAEQKDTVRFSPLRTNEYRYMLAAVYQRAGDAARALSLYQEVATNDLGNYMAHVQMSRLYAAAGDADHAIAELRTAADIDGDDYSMQLDLGTLLARAGQWAAADSALARATDMQPRDARAYYRLGIAEQQLGHNDAARHAFASFVTLAPRRYATAVADARQRIASLP